MFPILLILLGVGGAYLLSTRRSGPAPVSPPGGAAAALPPPPPPNALPSGGFESPEAAAVATLPRDLQAEVARLLASPSGDPNLADQLAAQLELAGFPQAAVLVRQKAQQIRTSPAAGGAERDFFVRAPVGLHVRSEPSVQGAVLGTVPFGRTVRVVGLLPSGWAQIRSFTSDRQAFVCNTCAEGGDGGPWLMELPPVPAAVPVPPGFPAVAGFPTVSGWDPRAGFIPPQAGWGFVPPQGGPRG